MVKCENIKKLWVKMFKNFFKKDALVGRWSMLPDCNKYAEMSIKQWNILCVVFI
jgi:hypothetical protein